MNKFRVTYFALMALVFAASCTEEAAEPDVIDWNEGKIYFRTTLSDVASSRGPDMTLDGLQSFQVTCFAAADMKKDEAGFISPYFENATFIRKAAASGISYVSLPSEPPRDWPAGGGFMTFFAFSPSLSAMAEGNDAITGNNGYFELLNKSAAKDSGLSADYRIGKIRVNPDIARQFDFVTATTSGDRWKNFSGGVDLAFCHQMSQVEIKAWGDNPTFDFEIAGVRMGNPVVEGTFVFSDSMDPASAGKWAKDDTAIKDKVEYLYRAAVDGPTQTPDTIYLINKETHNSAAAAASIMGHGGCAMVIPTLNPKWEGRDDPRIDNIPYSTDRMYISILMRVTRAANGKQIYPYPGNPDGLTVVHYAVNAAGAIVAHVYPGTTAGTFFTDSSLQYPYTAPDGVEIKEFGWAAVPVGVEWIAGKRYVYTLDYSEGIGVHDPHDPLPGTPIKNQPGITWGVTVAGWGSATPDDNYKPDIKVP